tara:strand:+ start:13013 stop:13684 length:672 start_codon:yes stop_codon:yes gene_type:complete
MKLSNSTIEVLKNFSSINPNILIEPGETLKTISEAKNIMAVAEINDTFSTEVGIYDLNEFLSAYGLVDDPDIVFGQTDLDIMCGNARVRYAYSSKDILTYPQKDINQPDYELSLNLSQDQLDQIKRAASVLGHSDLEINGEDGVVTSKVFDEKDSTANTFELAIDPSNACKNKFSFVFHIPNLKLLPGDYFVTISKQLISNWQNTSFPVNYFIALEKASEFHV